MEEIKKEVENTQYQSLSEFVSEAIRLRMQTLAKERITEYLERDRESRIPPKMLYTPKHMWLRDTPQWNIQIGITEYFLDQLKEIVNIRTDEVGERVHGGEPFGVAETWWFTYDLYSPLNAKIVAVNEKVIGNPFTLNLDPYQWIIEVQPEYKEVSTLMNRLLSLEEYTKLLVKLDEKLR